MAAAPTSRLRRLLAQRISKYEPLRRNRRARLAALRTIDRSDRGQMLRSEGTSSGLNGFSHMTPIAGHSSVCHKKLVCAIVLLMGSASALKAETVPLPRERPPVLEDQTSSVEDRIRTFGLPVAAFRNC